MNDPAADPFVRRVREQISALDRMLVETVNARLELVARLKLYKEEHGYSFNDPQREERLLEEVVRANSGPLSAGVRGAPARRPPRPPPRSHRGDDGPQRPHGRRRAGRPALAAPARDA